MQVKSELSLLKKFCQNIVDDAGKAP